jgi:hypothetical protein
MSVTFAASIERTPHGSHFYLLLKIQRLPKEQLNKVEDWLKLDFLVLCEMKLQSFFFPFSLKAKVC